VGKKMTTTFVKAPKIKKTAEYKETVKAHKGHFIYLFCEMSDVQRNPSVEAPSGLGTIGSQRGKEEK
jgi:hypothetical protein